MKLSQIDTSAIEVPSTGRGAWTSVGIDFDHRYALAPTVRERIGMRCEAGQAYAAAAAGASAIQLELERLGYMAFDHADLGVIGPRTVAAVKAWQADHRDPLTGKALDVDGKFASSDARAMFTPRIREVEAALRIPNGYLLGLLRWESALDPGAIGVSTPQDRGLAQINGGPLGNPGVSWEEAFDANFAINWAGSKLLKSYKTFKSWDYAIASHNSPRWAQQWASAGSPPNPGIAAYVDHVKASAY